MQRKVFYWTSLLQVSIKLKKFLDGETLSEAEQKNAITGLKTIHEYVCNGYSNLSYRNRDIHTFDSLLQVFQIDNRLSYSGQIYTINCGNYKYTIKAIIKWLESNPEQPFPLDANEAVAFMDFLTKAIEVERSLDPNAEQLIAEVEHSINEQRIIRNLPPEKLIV